MTTQLLMPEATIGERIRKARVSRGLTQPEVAKHLGVTAASISLYERGTNQPSIEVVRTLSRVLSVHLMWLAFGLGASGIDTLTADDDAAKLSESTSGGGRIVPCIDTAAAARDLDAAIGSAALTIRSHYECSPDSFAVRMWDSSAEPRIQRDGSVIIDPQLPAEPGRLVFAATDAGAPIIGRLDVRSDNGQRMHYITPPNGSYPAERLASADQIIGVITEYAVRA